MSSPGSDARVRRMLEANRAFRDMPGPHYESPKREAWTRFTTAWDAATDSERHRYLDQRIREIRQRHALPPRDSGHGPAAGPGIRVPALGPSGRPPLPRRQARSARARRSR